MSGLHVFAVPGGVVAHGVKHDRRMVLGRADIEFRMARHSHCSGRHRGLPIVLAEMRLGERDEHAHVVRGAQNLRKTQVRARLTAIVVSVDAVDADAFEAQQALLRRRVSRRRGPDLGIVKRDAGEEYAACR